MNPKLKKISTDIEKTRDKIAELQVKLRELEKQKTEIENTEVLSLFRSVAVTPEELAGFIQKYKAECVAQAAEQQAAEPQPEDTAPPAAIGAANMDNDEEDTDHDEL